MRLMDRHPFRIERIAGLLATRAAKQLGGFVRSHRATAHLAINLGNTLAHRHQLDLAFREITLDPLIEQVLPLSAREIGQAAALNFSKQQFQIIEPDADRRILDQRIGRMIGR